MTVPPDLPVPAGATADDWCDLGSPDAFREFELTSWLIGSEQYADDRLEVVVVALSWPTVT